jgi:hypothetical protein
MFVHPFMNLDLQATSQNTTAISPICSNDFQDAGVPSRKNAAGQRPQHRLPKVATAHVAAKSNKSPRQTNLPHPSLSTLVINTNGTANADKLKNLLLELSKDPDHVQFKTILRLAADEVRVKAFGYNRQTTKRRIIKLLEEFQCLEIEDFVDETGIDTREIKSALVELVEELKIKEGRRRRWQEPGKHYNPIFELV